MSLILEIAATTKFQLVVVLDNSSSRNFKKMWVEGVNVRDILIKKR